MPRSMTIGQVAERTGLTTSALRFYEERRLVAPPARSPSGYRLYDEESVARIRFIRRAQTLGLSLEEIRELLRATDSKDPVPTRERLRHLVAHKLDVTRRQAAELDQFLGQLEQVYLRLGQDPDLCRCTHLGSCDCVRFEVADGERRRMEQELGAIRQSGCSCGCDGAPPISA